MQGPKTFRVLLLLLACSWLFGCGTSSTVTPPPNDTVMPAEAPLGETRTEPGKENQLVTAASPTPPMPCAPAQAGISAVVTIGAILPLSSPGALLAGFSMQAAINIAVADLNQQGGIRGVPVRLVTYDSAGTPERAAQFAERLILLDCAVGIVGLYHNGDAMAVTDVAHRYGIPVIIAEAGADDITSRGYPEVFRLAPAYSMLAQQPALWLSEVGDYNQDGVTTATIIAENNTSGLTLLDAVQANLSDAGIENELMLVDLPSKDFSSVIARLVAHEQLPDAIFIYVKGQPALLLQSELLAAGIGPQRSTLLVQNYAGLNSAQFWKEVPDGNGTVVTRMGAWATTLTPHGQEFAIKYDQYLARWPESYAFASYDAICLLADALRSAPSWRGSDLVAELEATDEELTSGQVTFDNTPGGSSTTSYMWHQWAASQILYLQYTEADQPSEAMSVIWPPQYRSSPLQTAIAPSAP